MRRDRFSEGLTQLNGLLQTKEEEKELLGKIESFEEELHLGRLKEAMSALKYAENHPLLYKFITQELQKQERIPAEQCLLALTAFSRLHCKEEALLDLIEDRTSEIGLSTLHQILEEVLDRPLSEPDFGLIVSTILNEESSESRSSPHGNQGQDPKHTNTANQQSPMLGSPLANANQPLANANQPLAIQDRTLRAHSMAKADVIEADGKGRSEQGTTQAGKHAKEVTAAQDRKWLKVEVGGSAPSANPVWGQDQSVSHREEGGKPSIRTPIADEKVSWDLLLRILQKYS